MHAMTKTIRQILLPAALLAAAMTLLAAAPASAGWIDVLRDCTQNDPIQGTYKKKELQDAKRHVTGERIAYTECMAEISAAMNKLNEKDDGDGKGSGSDSTADLNGDGVVTPAEKRAAKKKKERQTRNVASVNDPPKPDSDTAGTISGDDTSGGSGLPL